MHPGHWGTGTQKGVAPTSGKSRGIVLTALEPKQRAWGKRRKKRLNLWGGPVDGRPPHHVSGLKPKCVNREKHRIKGETTTHPYVIDILKGGEDETRGNADSGKTRKVWCLRKRKKKEGCRKPAGNQTLAVGPKGEVSGHRRRRKGEKCGGRRETDQQRPAATKVARGPQQTTTFTKKKNSPPLKTLTGRRGSDGGSRILGEANNFPSILLLCLRVAKGLATKKGRKGQKGWPSIHKGQEK